MNFFYSDCVEEAGTGGEPQTLEIGLLFFLLALSVV